MQKQNTIIALLIIFIASVPVFSQRSPRTGPSVDFSHGPLRVHKNKRFIVHSDGTPFFYLGDTAWELFHRLNSLEAKRYLENRRRIGFTVIQTVVLAELDGLNTPNPYRHKPLIDNDPTKPNPKYFEHVDFIVNCAKEKGIYIGMLPTWGDKVTKAWGKGPVVFNKQNAKSFGRFIGNRYKNHPNIIWILGGDRLADDKEAIWRAMANGIKQADTGKHLMTYHPQGDHTSAEWFHNDAWLDFNMLQSGHGSFNKPNYKQVTADYNRKPPKPCLDGEPRYENHPVNWKPANGWFDDFDVRQAAYWNLLAGGFGHTYGCHDIWQMHAAGRPPISSARDYWYNVLDLPGAWDMQHVRHLMLSRPLTTRIPDQSLIVKGQQEGMGHIQATRGDDYALLYIPTGQNITVQFGKISGRRLTAWWFDPRTGKAEKIDSFTNEGTMDFNPPKEPKRGNDWILVIDDKSKNFPKPGTVR